MFTCKAIISLTAYLESNSSGLGPVQIDSGGGISNEVVHSFTWHFPNLVNDSSFDIPCKAPNMRSFNRQDLFQNMYFNNLVFI